MNKSAKRWVAAHWILISVLMLIPAGSVEGALDCNGCHGSLSPADYRPVDAAYRNISSGALRGNHRTHLDASAGPASCAQCHPGSASYTSSHRNGSIRISSTINNSSLSTAFRNHTSSPQSAIPVPGSCTNINCHFEAETPAWGSTPLAAPAGCSSCHGAPPADGNHPSASGPGKKHGDSLGIGTGSCASCHVDHAAEANPFAHATSAGKRPLALPFTKAPNNGGTYSGNVSYPAFMPSQSPPRNGTCTNLYCHDNPSGGVPLTEARWGDSGTMKCYSCHRGSSSDTTQANCTEVGGTWDAEKLLCSPFLDMSSSGHHRLVGAQWIRKYPCYYCHADTTDTTGGISDPSKHVNGAKDVKMAAKWNIVGRPEATYDTTTKVCDNVYCHSDGTTDPEDVRPCAWDEPKAECNSCHGHPTGSCSNVGCHDGRIDEDGKLWPLKTGWPVGNEWMGSMPMFPSEGAGTARANSHGRHAQTNFTCDQCHAGTVVNGSCTSCHADGIPEGGMGEVAHINAAYHVNKSKDVVFKDGGSYNVVSKVCSNTACHTSGADPVWGASVNSSVTCLSCHGTSSDDQDDYNAFNGTQARISLTEWTSRGHGRYSTAGRYPISQNPAANFPGNPCWYCHDNNVLHQDANNPYRLRMHYQYERRFEKECVYCHMERTDAECIACHVGQADSLAPQASAAGVVFKMPDGSLETRFPTHTATTTCISAGCHDSDEGTFPDGSHKGHDVDAGIWTAEQKADVKNQYMMMGVCLQCHDDDSGGQCTSCHLPPVDNPNKYALGFDPGTGYIKPKQARASAGHFGYKHYRAFLNTGGWTKDVDGNYLGVWKGGKFCWDCHDPHGDSNIYMVQKKIATTTDGKYGEPRTSAYVSFIDTQSGSNYARKAAPFDGICNVCHSPDSKHFTSTSGDGHNLSRRCTECHEHRFADSHADGMSCNSCHVSSKPIPKHTAFGLPRDCTKCHLGTVGKRMDVIGQMKSNSHHVQRTSGEIKNTDCYECHWESTPEGLIDITYHTGYNYKTYSSVKNDVVDLVVWGRNVRPVVYREYSTADGRATAAKFLAINMNTPQERAEVSKVSTHCISCHSDQNNDSVPFNDCKTPRQYAWDGQSVAARYSQTGTTAWGKVNSTTYANANKKDKVAKAFSAHGNAAANKGGFDAATGLDGTIPDRGGSVNVQCFDCHNSHGSKVVGVTSSYVTYNGTFNGANLKETKQNIGGYLYDYKASSNASGVNPYAAGAGQCFDCHNSAAIGTVVPTGKTPWGYNSTFGVNSPVMGYRDTSRFGAGTKAFITKNNATGWLDAKKTIVGGHMKASVPTGTLSALAKTEGTASDGSATTLVDAGKAWTANQWRNLYVLMTSGANSGQLSKITANDATSVTVEGFAAPVVAGDGYRVVPYSAQVNGLCTPCHDPHGVSPVLGSKQAYAVPLLKGTWMTSPYKEDLPEKTKTGQMLAQSSLPWRTDRNTFNNAKISEDDSTFAGLCINCHAKATLTDGTNKNTAFKTVDRIHESVKGWGNNAEHAFTCSKCHQPHNSGLPRLMQTDCLAFKHRGFQATGGRVDVNYGGYTRPWRYGRAPWGYNNMPAQYSTAICHGAPTGNGSAGWPNNQIWNNVTSW